MRKRALSVVAASATVGLVAMLLFAPAASAAPRTSVARLNGEKEVPGQGDPNGVGTAIIRTNWQKRRVCFGLVWSGLGPVAAAHIHVGTATEAGDVVVPLFVPNQPLPRNIRSLGGCVYKVARTLIGRIQRYPKRYYVNIHTTGFPDGAIRGQLHRP
jgi:hypothetical protein